MGSRGRSSRRSRGRPALLETLEVAAGPEGWLAALARLRPDLDLDLDTVMLSTWAEDPWVLGAYSARSATVPLDTEALARPVGPLFFAGEHTAGVWHGLMEGALRSGDPCRGGGAGGRRPMRFRSGPRPPAV